MGDFVPSTASENQQLSIPKHIIFSFSALQAVDQFEFIWIWNKMCTGR